MADIGGTLHRLWDYEVDPSAPIPWNQVVARINVRRVRLGAALALVDMAMEVYLNLADQWGPDGWIAAASLPIYALLLVVSAQPRLPGNVRLQMALPLFCAMIALANANLATAVLAASGRLTSAYPMTLMAVALVFLFPPRMLAALLIPFLLIFFGVIADKPVAGWEKMVAAFNATIATGVALISGWLIYTTRRREHDQRLLIHHQNRQIAASRQEIDELMALTAHDLHSPLLGLRNLFTLAVREAPADPALPLQVLRDCGPSMEAMLQLVRRLIEAHRAEQDVGDPPVHDDLRLHLAAAIERARPLAQSARVTLALDVAETPVCAHFDPTALARIFDNLLANAIRFSPAGGQVSAHCAVADGIATIGIADRGPGIAEADRPTLFHKFRQGGTVPRYGPPGTGIGLFIVATLAARIGATVHHEPAEPHGSLFEIALPHVPQSHNID